jgi:hypothetical protein
MSALKKKILNLFDFTFLTIPFLGLLIFLLIFLLSTYSWILTPNIFFGQNWDHQLTDNDHLSKNFFYNSLYVFHDNYGDNVLSTTQIFLNFLIFSLNYFYSSIVSNKLFLFLLSIFGFIINYKTLYFDYGASEFRKINCTLFSIFYCFSPYFFNIIVGGSIYAWFSYLLLPTYFIYFYRYLELDYKQKIYFYLISFLFICFLQYYILVNFFLFFYFFFYNNFSRKIFFIYIKIVTYQIVINLYWILPFLNGLREFKQFENVSSFFSYTFKHQSFFDAITMSGFLDRNFSTLSLNNIKLTTFVFVSILIFIYLIRNIINDPKKYKYNLFLLIALILSIFLSKKYNPPFGEIFFILNDLFGIFFSIFRSDQNLFILVFFIYFYLNFKNSTNNFYQSSLFVILVILLHSSGDYGSNILKSKNSSYISYSDKRYEFNKMLDDINININGRFLIFPSTISPSFQSNDEKYLSQGSVFEYNLFDNASSLFLDFAQKILILNKINHEDILLHNIQAFYLVKKYLNYHHTPNIKNYISNLEITYSKIFNKTFENDFYTKFETGLSSLYIFDYDKINRKILDKFEIKKINRTLYKSEIISDYKFSDLVFHQKYSANWCIFMHNDTQNFFSLKIIKSNFKCSKPFSTKLGAINSFNIKHTDELKLKFRIYLFNINQILFYFSILLEFIILLILFRRRKVF